MQSQYLPVIDQALCTGCGQCARDCPTHAVDMVNAAPVIARQEDCTYCGTCEEICPQNAISLSYSISIKPKS